MKTCLLVDDSDVIRKVARAILESIGYNVTEAENAKDALALCKSDPPDSILLDWQMPGTSTMDFLVTLRKRAQAKRPYVVYCTTDNDFADISRALAAGADDTLIKPFDRAMMLEKFAPSTLAA